LSTSMIYAKLC